MVHHVPMQAKGPRALLQPTGLAGCLKQHCMILIRVVTAR